MDKTAMRFALDAHRRGWHVFPCEPGEKTPALLYPGTDRPGCIKWYEQATNDINSIISWWSMRPDYNIGISAKKSGLLIVDCDVPKFLKGEGYDGEEFYDGWDQFQMLCERWGADWHDTIDTYQVETPSKGVHLYYWWPENVLASQASLDTSLDVRTNGGEKGGYVLGAGSQVSGWYHVTNPAPVKPAPEWLVNEVRHREPVRDDAPFRRPGPVSLSGPHAWIQEATPGMRNDALFWAAAIMAEEDSDCTMEDVYDEFVDDALEVGLTLHEIRGTVGSGYRTGVRNRE